MPLSTVEHVTTSSSSVESVVRRLGTVTWAGALLGLLVGGIGSRLAMLVLARLNPQATGAISDDGFSIGHFSAASLNLLIVTTLIGVLGGGIYFVLRGLMIGPRWFRIASISLGPAVVVGSILVHVEGVDFTVLDPVWLSIAMFVVIPGVYAASLTVVAERWLAPDGRFMTSSLWLAAAPLLLWIPLAPFFAVLLVGLLASVAVRRTGYGAVLLGHPAWPWLARAGLLVLFGLALVDLGRDSATLL